MNDQTVLEPQSEIAPQQRSCGPQKGARYLALAIVILLIVAAVVGFSSRFGERRALAKETEELAVPSVVVIVWLAVSTRTMADASTSSRRTMVSAGGSARSRP